MLKEIGVERCVDESVLVSGWSTHRAYNLLKFVINTETNCGATLEGTAKVQSEKLVLKIFKYMIHT